MADELLLHRRTRRHAADILKTPPQSLLITGPAGSGKRTLAEHIAASLLGVEPENLALQPYLYIVEKPENKQEISIDSIRDVIAKLRLKPALGDQNPVRRAVIIDEAHRLTTEAQNALLKTLEEPPPDTVFVLTAAADTSVLPTIASRTQKLNVNPVSLGDASAYFKTRYDGKDVTSAWQLSGGLSGLLDSLLKEDTEHPLKKSVESAKKFLALRPYERTLFIDGLSGDKAALMNFLDALGRILSALHTAAINNGNTGQSRRLITARRLVNSAADSLKNNASPRLIGLNLILQLPI